MSFQLFGRGTRFCILCLLLTLRAGLIRANDQAGSSATTDPIKPCTKSLSTLPTTSEIMAAGQLGGLLYPTHEEAKSQGAADDRKAFGSSIEVWNRHNYRDAASEFREFIQQYPDSPWTAEAKLHIGCYASYNGRYGEAESLFEEIIREQQGKQHSGAIMLLNKARQRLALVKVYQNNVDEAKRLFSELMKSPD